MGGFVPSIEFEFLLSTKANQSKAMQKKSPTKREKRYKQNQIRYDRIRNQLFIYVFSSSNTLQYGNAGGCRLIKLNCLSFITLLFDDNKPLIKLTQPFFLGALL